MKNNFSLKFNQPIIKLIIFNLLFLISFSFYGQTTIWEDNFETDKGWTLTGEFERGTPSGGSGDHGNANPTSGYNSSSNAIGTDLDEGYENGLGDHADQATSPSIDCSGYQEITISFQRWLNLEQNFYDKAYIDYYDGSTWTNIWTNPNSTLEETSWSLQTITLPESANNNANVQIRFAIGETDGGWTYSGWNIDDFKVEGYVVTNLVSHDFDSSDDGWSGAGWTRDNSSFSGYTSNHWHITPFNNYLNNTTSTLTSSTINLSTKYNLKLQFDVRYNTQNGADGLKIEYSSDNGSTWNILGSSGEGSNWYDDASVTALNSAGWTGDEGWNTASIELPGSLENNATVKFRFIFASNGWTTDDGVAFDNFEIYEYASPVPTPAKTWYAYSSTGDWSNPDSWTLDGAANPLYVNTDPATIPSSADYVKIHSGKKITVDVDNLSLVKLTVNGELDVAATTGHDFNVITGNGKISMSGNAGNDNFPEGTSTLFADPILGGTVEIYGTGINLDVARDFNNLLINLTSGSATLLTDYNIRGNLTVKSGDFKINDNTNTTPLNITVNGDVLVESGATMSVGTANASDATAATGYGNYHKRFHVFTANGDFTNQGNLRFTNELSTNGPDYNTRTSNGAVSLVFNGSQNNTFSCQGVTDLYYLIINKGTDQTYSLTLNATSKSNFALYGDVDEDWDNTDDANPENRKALWIKAGTLILEGYTTIPTLTEGGRPYVIGENASLVLNGTNVFVSSTALSSSSGVHSAIDYTGLSFSSASGIDNSRGNGSIYIYGTLTIDDGTLETSNSQGLLYRAESPANKLEINGGLVRTGQFRISAYADAGSAKMSYIQTGGELKLLDNYTNDVAIFDLSAALGSFTMRGGVISIEDLTTKTTVANAIEIACADNNINVSGGTVIINNALGTNQIATITSTAPLYNFILRENQNLGLRLSASLEVINDLTLEEENFNANNYDLYLGSDFTIEDNASYTAGTNTTVFNGTKLTNLNFTNTSPTFNNLTVAKTVDGKDFSITSATEDPAFVVSGDFRLENGDFDHNGYNVLLNGNIYLEDTIGMPGNTGYIQLNGGGAQTITSNGGVINNMTLTNGNGVSLTGDLNIYGTLTLTDAVFDISTYKLTMSGADANIVAGTGFAVDEMIMTEGNASDGGLELYLDANETLTFPIGTDAGGTTRYTPAVGAFSSFSDDGYIRISLADDEIPMTVGNGASTVISYYWKVRYSEFDAVPLVDEYIFTHHVSDLDGINNNGYKCGKVLDYSPYTQSTENGYDKNNYTITFNSGFNLELASYSGGDQNRFATKTDVYYSRNGGGNFNTPATWSKNDDTGDGTNEVPVAGAIVVIQNSDRVNVYAAINDIATVTFDHDYVTNPTPDSENVPRLQFHISGTFNIGAISGTGMVSFDAPDAPVVNGDFGEFGNNTESYYLYFGGDATLNNIPSPVPNLMVEGATYNINQNIDVNGDFIISSNGIAEPLQDITIAGDLLIGAYLGGTFQFPSQNTAINVNVEGNVDFTYLPISSSLQDRDLIVDNTNNRNVDHKLIVKGNIIHGSEDGHSIDLWNSNTLERVTLELQEESSNTYSRTSTSEPQLYRIILNKGSDQTYSFSFNNSFILNGSTNTATNKALELLNGTFILNDANTTIALTTGNPFSIPGTAALEVTQGTVQASGNDGGITLDGTLTINGGSVDMSIANDDDANYIEYGASGNAKLEISSGTLNVGTQIRRLSSNTSGVLNYTQTGGDVTIGVNSDDDGYDENRGMLEVLNIGSNFTYIGGTLTIVRQNGATPHVAALYLNPANSNITGSTITIGSDATPTGQNDIRIYSAIALNNLTINTPALADHPNVKLYNVNLSLNGNLFIDEDATFDCNSKNLTISGNMTNNGIFKASSGNLIFESNSAQQFQGAGTEEIYQFTKDGSGTLSIEKNTTINNDLYLLNGTVDTDEFAVFAKGNATLDGIISSTSGYGLVLSGELQQEIKKTGNGTSTVGILTINNDEGVFMNNSSHSLYITNSLRLEKGVFNIQNSLLELGTSAIIEEVESFALDNMIQTNNSFQDHGIKKNFPANYTTDFIFPVGQLTYSPITITLSDAFYTSGTDAGSLTVRPANEYHQTITSDGVDNLAPNDISNVLQYYWILKAETLTDFKGDISFIYDESDMLADDPDKTEDDYIGARILSNSGDINKFLGAVTPGANTILFHFDKVNENGIAGDYFAGIDEAIPGNVPTYPTNGTGGGPVNVSGTYDGGLPVGLSTPAGAILEVKGTDEIIFNVDNIQLYKTIIHAGGTLTINETERHRLGTVTGEGNLKIVSNSNDVAFPAGDYIDFFDCAGGGLEYSGTGSYTILGSTPSLRNLIVSGSNTKTMANTDVEICEDFTLNGSTFDNASNSNLTVSGDMFINGGTFQSGASNAIAVNGTVTINGGTYSGGTSGSDTFGALNLSLGTLNVGTGGSISVQGNINYSGGSFNGQTASIILNGSSTQTITGDYTGISKFYNLQINNTSGINLAGNITIGNQLQLTSGLISPSTNTLLIDDGATILPSSGSSSSYINGRLYRYIGSGGNFEFPIGKSGQYRPTTITGVTNQTLTWNCEYFFGNPTSHADVDNLTPSSTTIKALSEREYWVIDDGGGSSDATIGLSWGTASLVSSNGTERAQLEVMVWNDTDSDWDNYGGDFPSGTGTQDFGKFTSDPASPISFSTKIITLGSNDANNPLPVKLISFTGKANENSVELYWSTATEENNDYFEIQRSIDGEIFNTIGIVYGNGNSQSKINYTFVDEHPNKGNSFYRLKQVDYNGSFELFDRISINFNGAEIEGTDFDVYPNPYNSGELFIYLQNYEPYTSIHMNITSITGDVLFNAGLLVPNNKTVNLIPIAIDNLSQGVYVISIITPTNKSVRKLIVN